jgi:hypothetical protein
MTPDEINFFCIAVAILATGLVAVIIDGIRVREAREDAERQARINAAIQKWVQH